MGEELNLGVTQFNSKKSETYMLPNLEAYKWKHWFPKNEVKVLTLPSVIDGLVPYLV